MLDGLKGARYELRKKSANISSCASATTDWFTRNRVKPNANKNLLLYTSTSESAYKIAPIPLTVGDCVIPPSESVMNLGVVLDSTLSMGKQISRVCKIGFSQLRMIGKIRRFLTDTATKLLRKLAAREPAE